MKRLARIPFAIAAALALFACADSATTPTAMAPAASSAESHWDDGDFPGSGGHLVACENQRSGSDSEYIGPSGGEVRVGANRLIIPAGALRHTVRITATVPDDDVAYIRFEPHGLVFRKAPLLVLDAAGCNIGWRTPDVVYVQHGQILERIDARYYPQYKVVAAPIEHFSGYALAW